MSTVIDPFVQTASNAQGGDYERPEPGTYPARLVAVVDLGTHTRIFNGQGKTNRRLFLAWELCGENDSKGQAYVVGQDFTNSLVTKANYRKVVESWTGKAMVDGQNFNPVEQIDKPCIVTISEGQSAQGKKFTEISNVGPVTGGFRNMVVPPLTREPVIFRLADLHSAGDPLHLPEWLPRIYGKTVGDVVRESAEFGALPNF